MAFKVLFLLFWTSEAIQKTLAANPGNVNLIPEFPVDGSKLTALVSSNPHVWVVASLQHRDSLKMSHAHVD